MALQQRESGTEESHGGSKAPNPDNLALPFPCSSQRVGEVQRAGPYPAFLGGEYSPTWTRFIGHGTRNAKKTLQEKVWEAPEPYRGVNSDCRFTLSEGDGTNDDSLVLDRLSRRVSLAQQLELAQPRFESIPGAPAMSRQRASAMDLLRSKRVRDALDLRQEPVKARERYGETLFGPVPYTHLTLPTISLVQPSVGG